MLVLTRKPHQTIVIGEDITVTILDIQRDRVKVGFKAPDNVHILREELVGTGYSPHVPHEKEGMLILSRKVEQGVLVGKDISVIIIGIERGRVKVGTEAPSDIIIKRGELITEGRARGSKERF